MKKKKAAILKTQSSEPFLKLFCNFMEYLFTFFHNNITFCKQIRRDTGSRIHYFFLIDRNTALLYQSAPLCL